jgi:hypothetical protein
MNLTKRPLSVMVVACLYLVVGTVGFIFHFSEFWARPSFRYDSFWIELTELVAVVSGLFILRRQNWARWLAIVWIAFHVGLSFFHNLQEVAMHCLFFVVIAWALFRRSAGQYFRDARAQPI